MTEEIQKDELTLLKERADMMGISYHPSIGVKSLKEKVNSKLSPTPEIEETSSEPTAETIPQRNARLRKEANRLVRISLTCMNPMKRGWEGDMFSVSNKVIGTIKKYVPFNASDEGWHVPYVILKMLKAKQYQSFYEVQLGRKKIKKSKLVPEFAISILPALTKEELKELAQRQAVSHNID